MIDNFAPFFLIKMYCRVIVKIIRNESWHDG
jgi:hypothetical protein